MVSGFVLIAALLAFRGVYASASAVDSLPDGAKRLFEESMALNEHYWDDIDGYLYQVDTAGIHDTRATAMWAAALLARNDESSRDVSRAIRIIEQVVSQQYSDNSSAAWYGTFPHSPQDPFPGTSLLGNITYTTFDPNWRDFIGTAWLLAKEESGSLLPDSVVRDIEQSLYLVAKGQLLRYQGRGEYANSVAVQDSIEDNLDFAYTNPWLMGTIVMSYIGHKLNDTELIDKSNEDAQAVYDLFTFGGFNTFSEYNSGTYTGVDVWALALWIRYGPEGTNLKEYGTYMLKRTMSDLADFYHPDLRNLAGPWDRTYGFDMTRYHSIIGQIISSFVSIDRHAVPSPPLNGLHINDGVVFGSLIPLVIDTIKSAVSDTTLAKFSTLSGDGTVHFRQVRTNTEDPTAIRNVTVWLGDNISIGGQSLDEPSPRQSSHVSGTIQWLLPSSLYNSTFTPTSLPKIGYIVVTPPMSGVVNATASANTLTVSLPPSSRWKNVTLPFSLNFAVGGFDMRSSNADMTKGLLGVPGLNIFVETVGLGEQSTSYDQTGENNFYFFNVSYPVTAEWPTIPSITITTRAN